ncbi:hypothetical protein RvY_03934 [Ramazzottius varieornatus]|uniref:G-protein coupled receptors family 1 profile domain-containing protein n=1 Tax=Ramazzottius varieornatus TaxID=947166 RepID=A0A1D1UQK8_RAMVA|nr:hypothetical protein RvY_03934 [Ramazzottius varieornatus]
MSNYSLALVFRGVSSINGTRSNTSALGPSRAELERFLPEVWMWVSSQLIITLFGTIANGLVVTAICRFKEVWHKFNLLLLSLATSSLLFNTFTIPTAALVLISRSYTSVIPVTWCRYFTYVQHSSSFVTTLSVCSISINRFVAVLFPVFYRKLYTRYTVAIFALPCWILPYVVGIFAMMEITGKYVALPPFGFCSSTGIHGFLVVTLFVYIPTALMGTCYCAIFVKLFVSRRTTVNAENSRKELKWILRRRRTSLAMFLSFLVFCCTYYPTTIHYAISPQSSRNDPALFLWLRSLFYTATKLNPIIYASTNPEFLNAFRAILCCKGRRGEEPLQPATSKGSSATRRDG